MVLLSGEKEAVLLLTLSPVLGGRGVVASILEELMAELSGSGVSPEKVAAPGEAALAQYPSPENLDSYLETLAAPSPEPDLPTDRSRPAVQSLRAGMVALSLDSLRGLFQKRAEQLAASWEEALLAAYLGLLVRVTDPGRRLRPSRWTLGVGTLESASNLPLPFSFEIEGDPTFQEIVEQAKGILERRGRLAGLAFEDLLGRLQPPRDPSRAPLFQLSFLPECSWDLSKLPNFGLSGSEIESIRREERSTELDLEVRPELGEGSLVLRAVFSEDLFQEESVLHLLGSLKEVLRGGLEDPNRRLSELPLLSEEEAKAWLEGAPSPEPAEPALAGLHEAFYLQAEETPTRVALTAAGEDVTYRELASRALQLAESLRNLGVGRGQIVGVLCDRSPDLIASLLGVLRTGAAYLPLDPAYPEERLRFMLEDSGAKALIADAPRLAALWANRDPAAQPSILHLDQIDGARGDAAQTGGPRLPWPRSFSEELAYVIYTSGSTGTPKGVAVRHGSATSFVQWALSVFSPKELSGVLGATSVCFDLSIFEIFVPLSSGGRLVLVQDLLRLPEVATNEAGREGGVTLLNTVPSVLGELLQAHDLPESIETVNLAGELLLAPLVRATYQQPGVQRVLNLYGPSEDTTYSTWSEVPEGSTAPSIGHPVTGSRAYVADLNLRLLPRGIAGELLLGGAGPRGSGLARGYLRRPGLTAERFVPDPFSGTPGARLYRTGDRARWENGGDLAFLGRLDRQVKIRGFRIELGEVEAALARCPGVDQAAVVVRPGPGGLPQVVAFVGASGPGEVRGDDLRRQLDSRMPAHMVPAIFVLLSRLPLTPSGKIDRGALPEATTAGAGERSESLQRKGVARNEVEALVSALVGEVLGIPEVVPDDDFFELGGHSLLAARLAAGIRKNLTVDLPLGAVLSTPRVRDLAQAVAALRVDRSKGTGGRARAEILAAGEPIPRLVDRNRLPLTFAQEQLWLFEQGNPGTPTYNVPAGIRLSGPMDLAALRHALDGVVQRHEVLHSKISLDERGAFSHPEAAPGIWPLVDLTGLPENHRTSLRASLEGREAARPVNPAAGWPLRGWILRAAPEDHDLLLTFHHSAVDGWSLEIFFWELGSLYGAALQGEEEAGLPPLPVQVGDVGAWQRSRWPAARREEDLEFWQSLLQGLPAALELPTDRPRRAVPSYRGRRLSVSLPPELVVGLKDLARRQGATLFMLLLAAFQALLARLSGQGSLAVGTPSSHRPRQEMEDLVGYFVSILALPAQMTGSSSFEALLSQVRSTALDAFSHGELPFQDLVEDLGVGGDRSRNPIFQVLFQVTPKPDSVHFEGLKVEPLERDSGTSKFDLELSLEEGEGAIEGYLETSADLFDGSTLERWLGHWQRLLEGVVAGPETALGNLEILSATERQQLSSTWADRPMTVSGPRVAHHFFEEQAQITPSAPALLIGDETLAGDSLAGQTMSYRELEARSAALALHLRDLDVGPDVAVGLAVERSPLAMVGVLGILRAGGCYVPLDPSYPQQRLEIMVEDAGMGVLVTTENLVEKLPLAKGVHPVLLDRDFSDQPGEAGGNPSLEPAPVHSENLAYIIFTSGSTGRPKGVALSHGALANLIAWQKAVSTPQPSQRTLQFASLSFDVSFQEMMSTWATGGALVLVGEELRRDPARLLATLEAAAVDRIFLPFVALDSLAQEAAEKEASSPDDPSAPLREIITAGEQLRMTPALMDWLETLGECRLHNHYGPSETHVTTAWTLEGEARGAPSLPPIGKPVANHQAFVLDSRQKPAPCGVVGELMLGGAGLARGYLGRPGLTAERFIPDPCSGAPGARLYRTGDRARWLSEGDLEFLGRKDDQVKVRGYRVELGEIEAALTQGAEISEAVAVVREDRPGVQRLVAYVVAPGAPVDLESLKVALRSRLPEFMVPSAFVTLAALPLTPSGKVDRRRLPAPEANAGGPARAKTATERALARIWSELLPVEEIGPEDHFFELGGHSLVAARVTARVRQRFGLDLPVQALFDRPVLRDLASHLQEETPSKEPGKGLNYVPGTSLEGLGKPAMDPARAPLSWAQKRFFFLDRMEPGSPHYVLPNAIVIEGALEPAALHRSVREVVRRHEILRTTYFLEKGEPVQTVVPAHEVRVDLPVVDLRGIDSGDEEFWLTLAETGAARAFDLSAAPLLRGTLFRLTQNRHVFALDIHHVACDGWGLGVLFDEISALYVSMDQDQIPFLDPAPFQYSAYAVWEQGRDPKNRAANQAEDEAEALAYWRGHLAGAPQVLELPVDRQRPAFSRHRGRALEARLPVALTRALRGLARSADASLFMVVLTAFGWLLARLTGQRDMLLAVPVANRRWPELEGLVGCFMNVFVPRLTLQGGQGTGENLSRIRETTLAALRHGHLPLERLLEDLKPQRQDGHNPLFQVLFQVLNTPSAPLSLGALRGTPQLVDNGTSRVDLELTVVEEGEGLTTLFEYDRALFDITTVQRWSLHLEALLEQMVVDPRQPLELLALASRAERHQVRAEWNDTEDRRAPRLLHELFEAQVAQDPDAIAFVDHDRTLTYGELNTKANRLARLLASLGVRPGDPVGVLVGRTGLLPVSLMGILKAGAFYIPLDLTYPEERIVFMLEDACGGDSSVLVLVDDDLRDDLGIVPDYARIQYINLGSPDQDPGEDPGNPSLPASLRQTVYLLYTSGSTGRPKGVQIPHGAVVNFVEAMTQWPGISSQDTMLAVITAAFDMSVTEIFWPLSNGAKVVIAARAVASDGARLIEALEKSRATVLQATPATWHLLVQAGWQGDGRLKIITGGEALTPDLSRHLLTAAGEVWNLYGPTETTVFCGGIHYTGGPITVGRSFINTATHVLAKDLREVAMGVPGEAYISGDCLATGYFGRPALTAERFVPDPYSSWGPGRRMYRSGDVARWRPDGRLEILGRTDFQVKIRGFRIELEEIETVLADHPLVTQAAVLAREDRTGSRRLVAYLLLTPGQGQPSVGGLQTYLRKSLPGYMVPSVFVVLDAMPLTPNEKLDRQALPAPEGKALGREDEVAAPRTPTEAWVGEIFADLVGAEQVGPFDDFFALGGHSLLALHVITRVRERGGVELPLATLFRASTVEKLAAVIDGEAGVSSSAAVLLAESKTSSETGAAPFFCCHGVGGNVFRMVPLAQEMAKERSFYGLQGWADLHDVNHMSSVEQMAVRYAAEVQKVQPAGPYYLGGHSLGCIVAFEVARLLSGEGHEIAFLGLLDGPANPAKAAPSKAVLRSFNHEAHLALELGVEVDRESFERLSKEERLEIVVEKGIESNALPVGFTAEDARRYLEVYRITQEAWLHYRPNRWGGRAAFFSTKTANPKVRAVDPTDGWGRAVLGRVEVIDVPGDHNTMLRRPHVNVLAEHLQRAMGEAAASPATLVEVPPERGLGAQFARFYDRLRGLFKGTESV